MPDNKISVITVCFNCENLIERTVKSVIDQTYANIEYIVIDGGSTDNTLNSIKKYQNNIDLIVSEKDEGIYDAMNKGLDYVTGDLVYFLNAGDYFFDHNVLKEVNEKAKICPDYDIIYGDYVYYDNNSQEKCSGYRADIPDLLRKGYCHQTVFAKRSTFLKTGKFNTQYKIYSDFDWLLRSLLKFRQKMKYIDIPVVYYLKGGISETQPKKYDFERIDIIQKNISSFELLLFAISYPASFLMFLRSLHRAKSKKGFVEFLNKNEKNKTEIIRERL